MRLKMRLVGDKVAELHDEFGSRVMQVITREDGGGETKLTAVINDALARDIIAGLKLLDAVRDATGARS
ncbi:hypothetical protein EET67_04970 [Pseudaminobacter arsenicus]|uniref:Uncharacterized protein n=1 Tax=Borborobacter arsenicus TaxID=1851146 RepID=A0A432VA68_9HYPH|nr:hypothetical protein [Pseudaminobacter arsenicus]RUM98995.1 hypothetical protein EET67_04970 [Pseudaminobacter arsenicus]